jgi:hypothetical protein
MGVFDDKRYDQLDWVSQAVQPIETPLSAMLEKLPESTLIGYELMTLNDRRGSLDKDTLIESMLRKLNKGRELTWKERELIFDCFEYDMRSEALILNLEERTLTGTLYLIKTKFTLDEDQLKKVMGEYGREQLGRVNGYNMDQTRANEMLDLLEKSQPAMASRSGKVKRQAILNRLGEIFSNNEWHIKNTELANSVSLWIKSYIETGDLASLSNITRLKVMTYKDGPIYSIEETKC